MEYNFSKTLARIGGALILIGLVLPWYKFDLGELGQAFGAGSGDLKIPGFESSQSINSWEGGKTVMLLVGALGVLALSQIPFATPGVVGRFFMIAGFAGFVLLGYKIMSPPFDDILKFLDVGLKPQPGIYVALAGMAFASYGGWEQVKQDLRMPAYQQPPVSSDWHTTATPNAVNQGYTQQQSEGYAPPPQGYGAQAVAAQQAQPAQAPTAAQQVAAPRVIPPDPFAPKPPTAL